MQYELFGFIPETGQMSEDRAKMPIENYKMYLSKFSDIS